MTDTVLDTASTNATLFAGGNFGTIDAVPETGSFDTSLDHDWFAVSLIAGRDYVFSAMPISGTLNDVAIALRDSSRTILNSQGVVDAGPNLTSRFTYAATSSGTAYLDISAGGNNPASQTGQYFVTYADAGADTVLDTASTNASLTMGGTTSGRINGVPMSGSFDTSHDHDWFAVSLIAGQTYTFSAHGDGLSDVAIDLRDSSRTILDSQGVVDAGVNGAPSFTYTATSSGTVYLDISAGANNPAGLSSDYQIDVTDDGLVGDTVLDTALTNATLFAGGNFGTIDAVPMIGSFDTSLDHDWFAVSLTAGHDYTFSGMVLGGDSLNDVAIDLRNSSRTILNSQGVVDAGPNLTSRFTYRATSSGTVYLDISAGGNNPASQIGQYFVSYQDLGADTVLDTASTNASLTMGGTTSGRIDGMPESGSFDSTLDHDWFSVNLIGGHNYTFSATPILGSGNLNDFAIDLRNSSRTILDSQGVVDGGTNATSTFFYTATSSGTAYLDIGAGGNNPAGLTGGYNITATDNGVAPPPGLTINLIYDASALAAPQSFRDGMQAAANMLEGAFNDNITINIAVGYGEFGGVTLSDQNKSEGNIGYTGNGTNGQGTTETYSGLRTLLLNHEGSADDVTSVNSLPSTLGLQGNTSFVIGTAQGKALGVVAPDAVAVDGQVGMGTGFTGNALIAAALHEITHAMGRIAGDSLDLFRFNEDRSGSRVFGSADPATPAYFSIDGGATDLADFGINSDPGDFLNGGVQGPDPFNEFVNSASSLTPTDLRIMDVLGFHRDIPITAPGTTAFIGNFDGNPDADIVWVSSSGTPTLWLMNGTTIASTATLPTPPPASWHLSQVADFNGDGKSDLLWLSTNNTPSMWEMNGSSIISAVALPAPPMSWNIVGTGDFNGDNNSDILWLNTNNTPSIWEMNGPSFIAAVALPAPPLSWHIAGTGDFYGDGNSDIVWLNTNNTASIWRMNGTSIVSAVALPAPPSSWRFAGTADFNGDHMSDIMWQNSSGVVSIWEMNGANFIAAVDVGNPGSDWQLVGAGDFNGDGKSDLLFLNPGTSQVQIWLMNGTQVSSMQAPTSSGMSTSAQAPASSGMSAPAAADPTYDLALLGQFGSAGIGSAGVIDSGAGLHIASDPTMPGDGSINLTSPGTAFAPGHRA